MARTNLEKFLVPYLEQIQEVEDMFNDLKLNLFLDTAIGDQLDLLGEHLRLARNGLLDAPYRAALKFKVTLNKSLGEPELIISFITSLTNATTTRFIAQYPAGYVIYTDGTDTMTYAGTIKQRLEAISAAGVRVSVLYVNPAYETFAFGNEGAEVTDGEGFYELGYPEASGAGYTAGAFAELIS